MVPAMVFSNQYVSLRFIDHFKKYGPILFDSSIEKTSLKTGILFLNTADLETLHLAVYGIVQAFDS